MTRERIHDLKCPQPWYDQVSSGRKTHEVRIDDRDYQAGDMLRLVDPETKSWQLAEVTHVLRGGQFGIEAGYVVLSLGRAS